MPIRVLLVDDQALFREGLHTLLSVWENIEVVGEAANGSEGVTAAVHLRPDVVLMDLRMPVLDGVAATRRLRDELPSARVIILTTFDDDDLVFDGLRAGAVGYLLKDVSSQKLVEAIEATAQGQSFLQPSIAAKVLAEFARLDPPPSSRQPGDSAAVASSAAQIPLPSEPLSERELEILRLVAQGESNREIAARLFITEGTVKNHVTNILGKMGARDRTQAALLARDMGLL